MSFTLNVQFTGIMKLRREDHGKIQDMKREVLASMGREWHARYYDLHFTPEGAKKYHYGRRFTKDVTTGTVKTSKTGRRRAPNPNPLIWSGVSYILGKAFTVTATPTKATVTLRIPALNFRPRYNPALQMRDELTRVLPSEEKALAKFAEDLLTIKLQAFGTRDVVVSDRGKVISGAAATGALAKGTATRAKLSGKAKASFAR